MLDRILTVFRKEVLDNFRDRRSLMTALIYPLLGPVLLGILVSAVSQAVSPEARRTMTVPVTNKADAPGLVAHLENNGYTVAAGPDRPRQAVRRGDHKVVVVVPEGLDDRLAAGGAGTVDVVVNSGSLRAALVMSRVLADLQGYGRELSERRLAARGVDRATLQPLNVKSVNVARSRNLTDFFLFMIPPFVIFTVFLGGVYLAIDCTAGERERGSLEPLFTNPVDRQEFLLGKFLAAWLYTGVSVVVQAVAFRLSFELMAPAHLGLTDKLSAGVLVALVALSVPLMALATSVQIIIASLTRSIKEAQTYLGVLPLVPSMPALALVFVPVQPKIWMMLFPAFSQTVLLSRVVRGEGIDPLHVVVSAAATFAVTILLLFFARRLFEREGMVFSG